jgi:DNA-directed RNA polymerase subunit M/transcription elongation factor TFIIS
MRNENIRRNKMKDLEKTIIMKCEVCGNDQFKAIDDSITDFQYAPDDTEVKCSDCGKVSTLEQLIEDNSYIIDANIEDLKKELMKQLQKHLNKMFR